MFAGNLLTSSVEELLDASLTALAIAGLITLIIGVWLIQLASKNAGSGRTCWGWILTSILMCIPLVNIIMLFVWAFGSGTSGDTTFKCWARLILIAMLMGVIFTTTLTASMMFLGV